MNETSLAVFENYKIRRIFDENTETWLFSVVDIIQVLLQQRDYQTARKYWNKLKSRLKKEGSQSVTNCHQLKKVKNALSVSISIQQTIIFTNFFMTLYIFCNLPATGK